MLEQKKSPHKIKKIHQCPICNAKEVKFNDSFWVCQSCGYETAGMTESDLSEYYNEQDLGLKVQNILEEEGFESPLRNYHKKALQVIKKTKAKKICDIGCGVGVFLREMKDQEVEVFGYDINKTQASIARKKYNLKRVNHASSLEEYCNKQKIKKGFFDAITAFEVIEHVPDINSFVKEASKYLKKGGTLIISTPNRDRFYMRERWDYPPIHVSRITKKSVITLMEKHNLSVRHWESFNELGYYSNNLIHKLNLSQRILTSVVTGKNSKQVQKKLNLIASTKKLACFFLDIPVFLILLPMRGKGHTMFFAAQKK